jgi:signal transduction histidine kinase
MKRRRRSITRDLAALVSVSLLPLLILGGYLASRNITRERAAIYATALRQAQETTSRADGLIAETQALLAGLSRTPTIRQADAPAARTLLREVKVRFPYYDDLLAINQAGVVYAAASRVGDAADNLVEQAQFQQVMRDGQMTISAVLISPSTGRPIVLIGVPVRAAGDQGPPTGELAAALDLIRLQQWLDDRTLPPGTTITVVDNQQGRVLARSLDPEEWVGRSLADVPVVQAAMTRREGIIDGAAIDGIERLNAFATADQVPWSVLVGIPRAAVLAPVEREIRLMLLRVGLAAAAAAVLALVAGRLVVRPLQQLTAGANVIAEGDLRHRITVRREDEVGQVGRAMNRMADQLTGSIDELRQAQRRLEDAVAQVGRGLTSASEPAALLTPLVEAAATLTRADAGLLVLPGEVPPVTSGGLTLRRTPFPALLARFRADGAGEDASALALAPDDLLGALGMGRGLMALVRSRDQDLGVLVVLRREATPFTEGDGRLLRTFADQGAVALEQSRLRQAIAQAEALRELHRLQSDFLVTASHELRAPIAGIKGYAELLLRDDLPLDPATRHECIAGIDHLADRLGAQVRAFFDAMRAGAGRLQLRQEPVDLRARAESAIHGFAARAELHQFRLAADPALPPALADPERVEDVLTNLLDNAVKYSPEGGPIEVTIDAPTVPPDTDAGPSLRVSVRDRGLGIPPEEQDQVFERFYRLDRLMARRAGGAGLGLYLCRAYVEGMGGRIWVESRPGHGSTFRFTLPAAPDRAASPPRPASEVATP